MPFFELPNDKISFPPSHFADVDGLLAEGGGISADWLLAAYKTGVFLWSSPVEPLRWWAPDPRIILMVDELIVPTKLQNKLSEFQPFLTYNQGLESLMKLCEEIYNVGEMNPAWITGMFINAYKELFSLGVVRSVEIWEGKDLLGGVFGVVQGKVFFGEYVCGKGVDIPEIALIAAVEKLKEEGVQLIDLHKETMTTCDIGYREISKNEFVSFL